MDETHDPGLRSFIEVAAESHFPIQNLPYGVFRRDGGGPRIGTRIGDWVLDLGLVAKRGLLDGPGTPARPTFAEPNLNRLMGAGRAAWKAARLGISRLLRRDQPELRDNSELRQQALVPIGGVQMLLPAAVGDYTDFYSSREHATNVGSMFRGADKALMPNWLHLPVAYHGRSSSIVVSGTDLCRPSGQTKAESAETPTFGPSRAVDFELEMGVFVGPGNELGKPVPIGRAAEHLFGLVLVNDWSARDIQQWEYVPLGPFLAKNFGTSISPWVVTLEALEPYRVPGPVQAPAPLPYLRGSGDWAYDVQLEVAIQGTKMAAPHRVCATNYRFMYWNLAQQLAHHTVNGCNLRPGDLLASGTISGPAPESFGSLLELTWRGSKPLTLPGGERRAFIEDGDRVVMSGWCQGQGHRVGFGELSGRIVSAPPAPER